MVSTGLLGQLNWWVIITGWVIYRFLCVGKLLLSELRFEFTVVLPYSSSIVKYS